MFAIHDLSRLSKSTASVNRPERSIYRRAARAAAAETSQTPEAAQRHLLQVLEELPPAKFLDVLFDTENVCKCMEIDMYPLENVLKSLIVCFFVKL